MMNVSLRSWRRAASLSVAVGAAVAIFAAGRATGAPEAKTARPDWNRVAALDEGIRSVAASLSRIATAHATVRAMQEIHVASAAQRPALAAKAIEQLGVAAASLASVPTRFRITSARSTSSGGHSDDVVLAESPAPTGKTVEHWGDPHENLTSAIQAGDLTLTIRAPFPPAPQPTQPARPK